MVISELTEQECFAFLERAWFGRLACCKENQPYIVQVAFAYRDKGLYVLSTMGQKIEWMRENPNVCVSTDEILGHSEWTSVTVNGTYRELIEPRYREERELAHKLLERHRGWWETPLAERQTKVGDKLIESIYFRVEVSSVSGLRAQR